MTIVYIPGEDNTVADALSHVRDGAFLGESSALPENGVNTMLTIAMDDSVLRKIQSGYQDDEFCKKLMDPSFAMKNVSMVNGLWYIGDRLVIPHVNSIREDLYRLAHDNSGHFGADKSYATLRDTYYWPNMR